MSSSRVIDAELLSEIAASVGLGFVGAVSLSGLEKIRDHDGAALERWQQAGYAGEMRYMERPAELLARPTALEAQLRSVVSFAIPYLHGSPRPLASPPVGFGRVARYAWGRDYHRVLKRALKRFVAEVVQRAPELAPINFRAFTDAVPTLERAIASTAGTGVIGKNTMLIRPGSGSYLFLAEVLWDLDVMSSPSAVSHRSIEPCGSCNRCLRSCPTGAFRQPRVLDARRCISYLTIEKRGAFSDWESEALGQWVFGCDICQEVCPFNHVAVPKSSVAEFDPDRGAGAQLDLLRLLETPTADEFSKRFAGTAIMRAGWRNMVRNAAAVSANTGFVQAVPRLLALLGADDEGVAVEARRALGKLSEHADGSERRQIQLALGTGTSGS